MAASTTDSSVPPSSINGWLQQLLAHTDGKVILLEARFWTSNSSLELNRSTEKALCRLPAM